MGRPPDPAFEAEGLAAPRSASSQSGPRALPHEPGGSHTGGMARRLPAALLVAAFGLLGAIVVPQAAFAHDDETQEGYLLVEQALGHLAHDTGSEGIDLAMEKVGDAVDAEDQEGVDVVKLEGGMQALEAGQVQQARALLQASIEEALAEQPTATGYETGTTVVMSAMPGRTGLNGQDLGLLVGAVAVAGLGLVLAYRFRPRDSVRELRRRLAAQGPVADGDPDGSPGIERHP